MTHRLCSDPPLAWPHLPEFGARDPRAFYQHRPGAYALLPRAGELALVRWRGRWYLPGGGIEHGESPAQALQRELLEECGLQVRAIALLGEAVEHLYSIGEDRHFRKHGAFFLAEQDAPAGAVAAAADEEWHWRPLATAERELAAASQRWAVARYRDWSGAATG